MRRTTKRSQKSNAIQPKFKYMKIIYWSKVLTDQQGSCRFFRKHKIVKNLKTATIKQVIIHLSNLLKRFFRKSHYVFFLVKNGKYPTPIRAFNFTTVDYPVYWTFKITLSSTGFEWKKALICLSLSSFCAEIYQ